MNRICFSSSTNLSLSVSLEWFDQFIFNLIDSFDAKQCAISVYLWCNQLKPLLLNSFFVVGSNDKGRIHDCATQCVDNRSRNSMIISIWVKWKMYIDLVDWFNRNALITSIFIYGKETKENLSSLISLEKIKCSSFLFILKVYSFT